MENKSLFFKNALEIIAEAAQVENLNEASEELANDFIESILEDYESFDRLAVKSIPYTAEMIPVIGGKSPNGAKMYMVENEFVIKLMESQNLETVKEAMNQLCEAYDINMGDLYLVVEGKGDIEQLLRQSQNNLLKNGIGVGYNRLKNGCEYFKNIKNMGIKVLQKQDKYIPQDDVESLMLSNNNGTITKLDDKPFDNDDISYGSMYNTKNGVFKKEDDSQFANDDIDYGSMKTSNNGTFNKNDNNQFTNDDIDYGSMYNPKNGVYTKKDSNKFIQDDDTNPMPGNPASGVKVKLDNNQFHYDDPNLFGMSTKNNY